MHLTLVAPGLLAVQATELAGVRALARYSRYACAARNDAGFAMATLAAIGLPQEAPAPLLALGAGLDCGDAHVLVADPVTLVAGRDDVRLAAPVDDLDAVTSAALVARLNAHFQVDGLVFAAPRPARWFARMNTAPALATTATDVVAGKPIFPFLPQGDDARTWQRWSSEIQMLLHNAPEHAARERAGLAPVNGVWFWGGGRCTPGAPGLRTYAPADASGDLLRGLARRNGEEIIAPPLHFDTIDLTGNRAALVLPLATAGTLADLAETWFKPALAALEHGRLESLALVADGDGVVTWTAPRPRATARLAAALGRMPFAVPVRP